MTVVLTTPFWINLKMAFSLCSQEDDTFSSLLNFKASLFQHTKRKLDDVTKRLEGLYDRLREQKVKSFPYFISFFLSSMLILITHFLY